MPTQIVPTPIVTGKAAKKALEQLKMMPTEKTKRGIAILTEMFKDKEYTKND